MAMRPVKVNMNCICIWSSAVLRLFSCIFGVEKALLHAGDERQTQYMPR